MQQEIYNKNNIIILPFKYIRFDGLGTYELILKSA